MLIASILVPLFMLVYYRFSGIVAVIALVLNMLILFAFMLAFKAAFTLTGFAGLALTVGMAVNNNILVFERLWEEHGRGATLRMAIRNAFHRAGTTIVDCNLTHMIAATVLWFLGTDQLIGFRRDPLARRGHEHVHLGVRLACDLRDRREAAVDPRRQDDALDRAHEYRLHELVPLLPDGVGADYGHGDRGLVHSRSRFVRHRLHRRRFGASGIQGAAGSRLCTAPLEKQPEKQRLPDLAINDVQMAGQPRYLQFLINTSESDPAKVQAELKRVFPDKLAHNSFEFAAAETISAAPAAKGTHAGHQGDSRGKSGRADEEGAIANDLPSRSMLAFAGDASLALRWPTSRPSPPENPSRKRRPAMQRPRRSRPPR